MLTLIFAGARGNKKNKKKQLILIYTRQ